MYNRDISLNALPTPYSSGAYLCLVNETRRISNLDDDRFGRPVECRNITSGSQEYLMGLTPTGKAKFPAIPSPLAYSVEDVSRFLLNGRTKFESSQIGAYSFSALDLSAVSSGFVRNVQYIIHGNYTAVHAGPLYSAIMADTVVKSVNPSAKVTVTLDPLPATNSQNIILSNYNSNLVVIFILLAIPYIPAAFATFIVREREVKAKHQQLVSGVSIPAYWLAAFIWDNFSYQLTVWLIVILIAIFPNSDALAGPNTVGPTIGLLILFGSAISGFTYLVSFRFSTPSGAQIGMYVYT
jgi:hypothetical protein